MNSAGSSDSMISIHSGYSDDSLDYLSAEERACLMYLEEAIGSLETEDDSGLSNDESHIMENKISHRSSVNPEEIMDHDDPNKNLRKDQKHKNLRVPTPLVLANGNGKFVKKPVLLPSKPNSPVKSYNSAALLGTKNGPLHSPPNPGTPKPNGNRLSGPADLPPSFIPEPPVKSGIHNGAKAIGRPLKMIPDQKHSASSVPSMELLPPPSDFMDEQTLPVPVYFVTPGQSQTQHQAKLQLHSQPIPSIQPSPENFRTSPSPSFGGHDEPDRAINLASSPKGYLSPGDINILRKQAASKKAPQNTKVVVGSSSPKVQQHFPSPNTDASSLILAEHPEPKTPPAVAPKPKMLPSSIILKNHKEVGPGHLSVTHGDNLISHQKVHMEALKKLGLLKGDEADTGVSLSPPRRVSPHSSTNSRTFMMPTHGHESLNAEQQAPQELHRNKDMLLQPPVRELRPQSPKPFEIKSMPLDQTNSGLKSLTLERPSTPTYSLQKSNVELLPEQTPIPRSRLASTGSWKDFGINHLPSESQREMNVGRSRYSLALPSQTQLSMDSPKPLRSHGISVVISPQNKSAGDHKMALKKLGLFK